MHEACPKRYSVSKDLLVVIAQRKRRTRLVARFLWAISRSAKQRQLTAKSFHVRAKHLVFLTALRLDKSVSVAGFFADHRDNAIQGVPSSLPVSVDPVLEFVEPSVNLSLVFAQHVGGSLDGEATI
jgi:hypothetical protein